MLSTQTIQNHNVTFFMRHKVLLLTILDLTDYHLLQYIVVLREELDSMQTLVDISATANRYL